MATSLAVPFSVLAAGTRSMWRVWVFVAGLPGRYAALDVGALAAWGEPTGLALSPDGSVLVLG